MAGVEHPDMPKSIAGIQGFNLWNVLFIFVFIAWLNQRRYEGLRWDIPGKFQFLFFSYFGLLFINFLRLLFVTKDTTHYTNTQIISEFLINTFKWVLPGILLYDGCRSKKRVMLAVFSIIAVYLLLALQTIKVMPLHYMVASGEELSRRAAKRLGKDVGYFRTNLSMMFSGASWAVLMLLLVAKKKYKKITIFGISGIIALAQSLTGGRTGYVTWGMIGFIIGTLKWRRILFAIPILIYLLMAFVPGVKERMLTGIGGGKGEIDQYEITSGRTVVWPYVIEEIRKKPVFGHGREAMQSTGLALFLWTSLRESFPHPHNAYLELLLDNGIIGFFAIIPFYIVVMWCSFKLFLDKSDPFCSMIGGFTSVLVLALLVAGLGGQTFYPKEGNMGMWAAIGIMLRVYVERSKAIFTGQPLFNQEENE
jgi:O-antigen ligase